MAKSRHELKIEQDAALLRQLVEWGEPLSQEEKDEITQAALQTNEGQLFTRLEGLTTEEVEKTQDTAAQLATTSGPLPLEDADSLKRILSTGAQVVAMFSFMHAAMEEAKKRNIIALPVLGITAHLIETDEPILFYRLRPGAPQKLTEALSSLLNMDFFGENLRSGDAAKLVTGTSKLFAHQHRYLTNKTGQLAEALELSNKEKDMRARSVLSLPRGMEVPTAEDVLQKMQDTLLKRKANGASLLKTHLYLIDKAYKAGGDSPSFTVDLDDLLEAKGYKRQSHGLFDPETYRSEYGRIVTLAGSWIGLWKIKGKRQEVYMDETPYWELRARRSLIDGDALGLQPILLADPAAPIIKQVIMQPGLWWAVSDVGSKRIEIPRSILALPTDGKGNETERMAVQLAATLALWVRSSQNQHAGKARCYSVGALLEASGYITHQEFISKHAVQAARIRKYLAGEDGLDGALATLRRLEAFDIDIADEEDFWASGRGWADKFWEAQLKVTIPDLKISKRGKHKA